MADFLDDAADNGLLGGLVGFGGGFIKGMENAEDRKYKRMEFEAKQKATDWEKEKKQLEAQNDKTKRGFEQAGKLRDDWLKNQTTKNSQSVKEAYDKIKSAPQTAAGDMSLIYGFMRMQDPGSTVREGEFATAQNAASVPDQVRNMYNRAISGQRLNPNQRNDFINSAGRIYSAQQKSQGTFDEQFGGLADTYGIPRNEVVLKIFEDPQTGEQKVVPVPASKGEQFDAKFNASSPEEIKAQFPKQGLVKPKGKGLMKQAIKPKSVKDLDKMTPEELEAYLGQ